MDKSSASRCYRCVYNTLKAHASIKSPQTITQTDPACRMACCLAVQLIADHQTMQYVVIYSYTIEMVQEKWATLPRAKKGEKRERKKADRSVSKQPSPSWSASALAQTKNCCVTKIIARTTNTHTHIHLLQSHQQLDSITRPQAQLPLNQEHHYTPHSHHPPTAHPQ
jgi:hypothetical protein